MKRILINATEQEELRVALVNGKHLFDLDIESSSKKQKKANIYKGKVSRVEPSLDSAFVDFGCDRHGFLPLKEIIPQYFPTPKEKLSGRPTIKDSLVEGQEIIVQVDKEERGNKGAALTTFVSLAGRYLVLMPNNPNAGGISRRIEGEGRAQLKAAMAQLKLPERMGVIVRTAGLGQTAEDLQADLDYLVKLWDSIEQASHDNAAPFLIYQESNVVRRAVRDYMRQDIDQILIDDADTYADTMQFIQQTMPQYQDRISQYEDSVPIFSRFQIESQIDTAFQREVRLPSGGSIVIDTTEALVSIDINSSRATKGSDIEETALQTNLEAAEEIARQLRLRDIGGLIVIDFIDMSPTRHQKEVENRMHEALQVDRARVQLSRISRFGIMEMSRQRLRSSLGETSGMVCPRCLGQGSIRDIHSLALSVLRLVEEEAMKDRTAEVHAHVPIDVATFLLNEKRGNIASMEERFGVRVVVIPSAHMHTPHFEVKRLHDDNAPLKQTMSFDIAPSVKPQTQTPTRNQPTPQKAMVQADAHRHAASTKKGATGKNWFQVLLSALIGLFIKSPADNTTIPDINPKKSPQKPQRREPTRRTTNKPNERNERNERNNRKPKKTRADASNNPASASSNLKDNAPSQRDKPSRTTTERDQNDNTEERRRRPRSAHNRRNNRPSQRDTALAAPETTVPAAVEALQQPPTPAAPQQPAQPVQIAPPLHAPQTDKKEPDTTRTPQKAQPVALPVTPKKDESSTPSEESTESTTTNRRRRPSQRRVHNDPRARQQQNAVSEKPDDSTPQSLS